MCKHFGFPSTLWLALFSAAALTGCMGYTESNPNSKPDFSQVPDKVAKLIPLGGLEVDFGVVAANGSGDAEVYVANAGKYTATDIKEKSTDLIVAPFGFKGGTFPGTGGTCGTELDEGKACTLFLTFSPTATGSYEDILKLTYINGAVVFPLEVTLKGRAP